MKKKERQKDRKTERQKDRKTERQKDRKTYMQEQVHVIVSSSLLFSPRDVCPSAVCTVAGRRDAASWLPW